MTKLASDAWIAKAKERKAYRDHYRDKFFRENGVEKGSDPLTFAGAPKSQRRLILKLMKVTKAGGALDKDQEDMLAKMAGEMLKSGLGTGELGSLAETISPLDDYSYANLKKFFF